MTVLHINYTDTLKFIYFAHFHDIGVGKNVCVCVCVCARARVYIGFILYRYLCPIAVTVK
jgi:hypothetical protein